MPELSLTEAAVLLPLGLAVGTIGAMVGIGGGPLLVPALLFIFPDAPAAVITSMSLTAVLMNATSANLGYRRRKWQDTRTGIVLLITAVPAAVAGAFLTRGIERGTFELVLGSMLAVGSLYLAWKGGRLPATATPTAVGVPRHIIDREQSVYDYRVRERLAMAIALGTGFAAAFFGIGGGIINVPIMMLVLKMPMRMSVATSQIPLVGTAVAAITVHLVFTWGEWAPWVSGLVLGAGTMIGAQIGVRLAGIASGRAVLLVISAILFTAGVRQIFSGL